jgi:hypothetical protein
MNAEVYITNPNSNTVGTFSCMNLLKLLMYLGYINLKQTYLADEKIFYNATVTRVGTSSTQANRVHPEVASFITEINGDIFFKTWAVLFI